MDTAADHQQYSPLTVIRPAHTPNCWWRWVNWSASGSGVLNLGQDGMMRRRGHGLSSPQ